MSKPKGKNQQVDKSAKALKEPLIKVAPTARPVPVIAVQIVQEPVKEQKYMVPRSHQVAQAAYERIAAHAQKTKAEKKKYGALAHKLPVLILQNGLAQATGFLLAKGKTEHIAVLDDLAQVLRTTGEAGCEDGKSLHQTVINADTFKTMHLTRRALEASGWLKRYVQGILKIDATGESEEEKPA